MVFKLSYQTDTMWRIIQCVPTLVWMQSKQMRPELMMCRTDSMLVPYKFFSYSPNSMNFPLAKSVSKAVRLTKLYWCPFRSFILGFLVVSEPGKINMNNTLQYYTILLCFCYFLNSVLTWNSNGKFLWFSGQKPLAQSVMATVCRTNQSNRAFSTCRLVKEWHLFVGQNVIIV